MREKSHPRIERSAELNSLVAYAREELQRYPKSKITALQRQLKVVMHQWLVDRGFVDPQRSKRTKPSIAKAAVQSDSSPENKPVSAAKLLLEGILPENFVPLQALSAGISSDPNVALAKIIAALALEEAAANNLEGAQYAATALANTKSQIFTAPLARGSLLTRVGEFHLNDDEKSKISEILGRAADVPELRAFLAMIEYEIARFKILKPLLEERTSALEVREVFSDITKNAGKLYKRLASLDPDTYRKLDIALQALNLLKSAPAQPPTPWNPSGGLYFTLGVTHAASKGTLEFIDRLNADLKILQQAISLDTTKEHGGMPPKYAQVLLARGIADAFKQFLKEEPKSTRKGPYEQILRLALNAAGQHALYSFTDLHAIVLKGLRGTQPPQKF